MNSFLLYSNSHFCLTPFFVTVSSHRRPTFLIFCLRSHYRLIASNYHLLHSTETKQNIHSNWPPHSIFVILPNRRKSEHWHWLWLERCDIHSFVTTRIRFECVGSTWRLMTLAGYDAQVGLVSCSVDVMKFGRCFDVSIERCYEWLTGKSKRNSCSARRINCSPMLCYRSITFR